MKRLRMTTTESLFERGPLVYCAEGIDNAGHVLNRFLKEDTAWTTSEVEIIPDVTVTALTGEGNALYQDAPDTPLRVEEGTVTLIPYYAWAHRGAGEMQGMACR